jgi:co-chaperonin GroES (HSP10)
MVTVTKEGRSTALRLKPSGDREFADRAKSEGGHPGAINLPGEARDTSKRGEVVSRSPGYLDKAPKRARPTVIPGGRVLPELQAVPSGELVAKPLQSTPSLKEDQVSLMKRTYRAIWTGILSEERIEEESRWIEKLFQA